MVDWLATVVLVIVILAWAYAIYALVKRERKRSDLAKRNQLSKSNK